MFRELARIKQHIKDEIEKYGYGVLVFRLVPEHITGKITKES